jgi:dihydroflavonol-4-reductase
VTFAYLRATSIPLLWQLSGNPRARVSNKDKVLATGASGFIGSAVARCLIEAGLSVRALVRSKSPRAHLAELDLDFCEGDLRDQKSLERASAGMRYVFHLAANYRLWARDPSEIFATNVEGARNVIRRQASVTRR